MSGIGVLLGFLVLLFWVERGVWRETGRLSPNRMFNGCDVGTGSC